MPAVVSWLRGKYVDKRVPEPSFEPRKSLIAEAIKEIPSLGGKLSADTMGKAINAYHSEIDPN